MLCHAVNICKLRVHCLDVCNIALSTCISVNCVKIPLIVIRSNVHNCCFVWNCAIILFWCCCTECKWYFFTACRVVCFKKTSLRFTYQVIYVRNIPIHNWIHLFCLTTCFFGFIRFRCNILLKKIFTDLLLLALILALSVNKFPNLSCAITWTVDWCQIYIFITQKSGNFKYTLHCVRACVIMITLNRF